MDQDYEIVIGLEVHAQLLTRTKLFCGDTTRFGLEANTQISSISLGHPGTLPCMNKEAIGLAIKLGLACHCSIVQNNYFARKNYFYPDLPKGYQVSQHTAPICRGGYVEINVAGTPKKVRLNRIHMEEDAGKSLHNEAGEYSDIDYNRAGMPLLEIVTEPDLSSAEEAFAYVTALRKLVRHLNVCDGNMEEGSLRCDVNISVRPKGDAKLGTKVEIKNLNSIRFIRRVIETESNRLISLHRCGEPILQQTRGLNEADFTTYAIRTKEDEDDYRYFPEPDLPPFHISDEEISRIKADMPLMPDAAALQLRTVFNLSEYDAAQLSAESDLCTTFNAIAVLTPNYKAAANWVLGPIKSYLAANENCEIATLAPGVAALIHAIDKEVINFGIATQKVWPQLAANPLLDVDAYILEQQLRLTSNTADLDGFVEAALQKHEAKIAEYKKGKKGLISLFVGEVMKLSKGKADARVITEKIAQRLK